MQQGKYITIALVVVVFMAIACGQGASSPRETTLQYPKSNELSYDDILTDKDKMTDAQRQQYFKSLYGTTVHWKGKVDEASSAGGGRWQVLLKNAGSGNRFMFYLTSEKEATSFSLGQTVAVTGTIKNIVCCGTFVSGLVVLDNVTYGK